MKRAREGDEEDEDDGSVIIQWNTREGPEQRTFDREFLIRHSEFFQCLFRNSSEKKIEIKLVYPREIVRFLFSHLDGQSMSMTERQELQVKALCDYLKLQGAYSKVENIGFESLYCAWCSSAADGSLCTAKRFVWVNNSQQCVICCERVQSCRCVHENEHCTDASWVFRFQRRSSLI